MFYALFVDNFNDTHVVGEGATVQALLDSIKVSTSFEIIVVQRIKKMVPTTEVVWKEVKGT